jgi:Lon protease-like protein
MVDSEPAPHAPGTDETAVLPIFPLGTVLLPGLALPLHIFEDRYRRLVADLLELPEKELRQFGVVAIRQGREVGEHAATSLHEVGCTAVVQQVRAYPDGRFDLLAVGVCRFTLGDLDPVSAPYLRATVHWLPEDEGDGAELVAQVQSALLAYAQAMQDRGGQPLGLPELPDEPLPLSYLATAALSVDTATRQRLLAAANAGARLRMALGLLRRESGLLGQLPSVNAADLSRQRFSPN